MDPKTTQVFAWFLITIIYSLLFPFSLAWRLEERSGVLERFCENKLPEWEIGDDELLELKRVPLMIDD